MATRCVKGQLGRSSGGSLQFL